MLIEALFVTSTGLGLLGAWLRKRRLDHDLGLRYSGCRICKRSLYVKYMFITNFEGVKWGKDAYLCWVCDREARDE